MSVPPWVRSGVRLWVCPGGPRLLVGDIDDDAAAEFSAVFLSILQYLVIHLTILQYFAVKPATLHRREQIVAPSLDFARLCSTFAQLY